MNNKAMTLPKAELIGEIERRIEQKSKIQVGIPPGHIPLTGYMENIGWPELFGFRMDEYFMNPDFAIEQFLRQQIWWADNVDDETMLTLEMQADVGMYWDMTLFGQDVIHTDIGVPEFPEHPFRKSPDVKLLGSFDFFETGVMPQLIAKYHQIVKSTRIKAINSKPIFQG